MFQDSVSEIVGVVMLTNMTSVKLYDILHVTVLQTQYWLTIGMVAGGDYDEGLMIVAGICSLWHFT